VRRLDEFDERLNDLCARLHVHYVTARNLQHESAFLRADELHEGAEGQRLYGELEGRLIAEAWLASSGQK
jgi:hypothetical protein